MYEHIYIYKFTLRIHNEFKMYTALSKIVQCSATFPFEISTDWCSMMIMAWIGSKHATYDIGLQNIRG
jgi:hypothetical protein